MKMGNKRGNVTLEFSLVGIPLIFILISVAGMTFAMMTVHTMQEAVEQGARYAVTHGKTCTTGSNSCSVTIGTLASIVAAQAAGINSSSMVVTFTPDSGSTNAISCNPLSSCVGDATVWPPSGDNNPGKDLVISADYTYATPIAMFWPGAGGSNKFGSVTFHAYSRQRVMY
jgi:Flp pilus assembly protein TadG